ncbi:DegV family protein [Exiguobacterium sp. s189]|uniref:DegV family protein n=1 Tax=Exiguobacterium sp. s189 TaxID=2751263 RepID=UPI001BE84FF5|nr:DegV family protein [Exiguobacterium sp. s189]
MDYQVITDAASIRYMHHADKILPVSGALTCFLYENGERHYFFEERLRAVKRNAVSLPDLREQLHRMFSKARRLNRGILYLTSNAHYTVNYQESLLISKEYDVPLQLIDTKSFLYGQAFIVDQAIELRKQGISLQDSGAKLREVVERREEYLYTSEDIFRFSNNVMTSVNERPTQLMWTTVPEHLRLDSSARLLAPERNFSYGINISHLGDA